MFFQARTNCIVKKQIMQSACFCKSWAALILAVRITCTVCLFFSLSSDGDAECRSWLTCLFAALSSLLSPVSWCDGCVAGTSSLRAPPVPPHAQSSVSFLPCKLSLLQPHCGVWLHRPEGHPQTRSSIHTGGFITKRGHSLTLLLIHLIDTELKNQWHPVHHQSKKETLTTWERCS